MSKKHINASDESGLRHFARHTKECASPGKGGCNYEDRSVGPLGAGTFPKSGFGRHHILPVSSVGKFEVFDAYDDAQRKQIRDVYAATKWCTSRDENLIVLPLKREYRDSLPARSLNRPCHDVDHNCAQGYTDEVTVAVEARIWRKFRKAADKAHPNAEDILADLSALETDFRAKLTARGLRKGGITAALTALSGKGAIEKDVLEKEAWLPFSMAKDRVARKRPLLTLAGSPEWLGEKLRSRYARKK